MSNVRGFQKNQIPIAVMLLIAIVVVIALILVFGGRSATGKNQKTTTTTPPVSSTTDKGGPKTTVGDKTTTTQEVPPSTSRPADYTTKSSIVISGTSAMEMYGISPKSLQRYAQTINSFSTLVPKSQVYVMLVPTSIEFYGPEKFTTGNRSQEAGINMAYSELNPTIKRVDVRSQLRMHTDEYIYFRTDHHWTARGAYYAYTAFAKTAGFIPSKIDTYTMGKIEGFVGSMYRYTQAQVLKDNPDYVETFIPKTPASGVIYSDATMSQSRALTIVASNVAAENKYLAFIQGDNPLIRITTDNKNGKSIIIIKESYGNALAPFMIDNYEEIYVTDPRRIDMNLANFVNANGINDVLFVNYTFAPSNSTYMTAFLKMLGK